MHICAAEQVYMYVSFLVATDLPFPGSSQHSTTILYFGIPYSFSLIIYIQCS